MTEELRRVRDTLIEELRKSETLTVASRALFNRYAALCEAAAGAAPPAPDVAPEPPPPARPQRPAPVEEEDEEFGGSFMVRPTATHSNFPGYREGPTQPELPRSLRDRRR
jgi:hypothetical protein